MTVNTDLGEVILRLNPYSNNPHLVRGSLTGPVDIYMRAPPILAPREQAQAGAPTRLETINRLGGREPTGTIADIELEMEGDYPAEWTFKGQPQKVFKTVRIKYRYPMLDGQTPPNILYWVEDYMLIGFEGGPA